MYIDRILEKTIKKYLNSKEIIAVIGPRQSGKTTLLKHIYEDLKNGIYLDFEDRKILGIFEEDIETFIELYVKPYNYLFIDEFQYAKQGGKNLKYIYDNYKIKIVISGSSATSISINSIKYLVGRIFVFNLYSLSFEEYLNYKDQKLYYLSKKRVTKQVVELISKYFEDFCIYGGYPRVVLANTEEEKEIVLRNIYNTYFLKEIKEILNIKEDYKLGKLINVLALQIGNIINYKELSDITGFNYKELMDNLNIAEKTFICIRSQPFFYNKRTEIAKTPKIFFIDNGFRNMVINNFQKLKGRVDKGQLYENFVATEIIKKNIDIKYWRTKSKAEVDFIIEKKGKVIPLEVKSSLKKEDLTRSFNSFLEKYKPKSGLVLSESLYGNLGKIKFRPIFLISYEL